MSSGNLFSVLNYLQDIFNRENLGSNFTFVLLEMNEEDSLDRIRKRHDGDEKIITALKVRSLL